MAHLLPLKSWLSNLRVFRSSEQFRIASNKVKRFFHRILPTLYVHSWGGLGSQLFTAHVILRLQDKYPGRRLKVIAHTSGVTRRTVEFDFKKIGVVSKQIEDYFQPLNKDSTPPKHLPFSLHFREKIKTLVSCVMLHLHIIEHANDEKSLDSIRPWTLNVRGHYTRLTLKHEHVNALFASTFKNETGVLTQKDKSIIHLRLGDLVQLSEKGPISLRRIETLVQFLGKDLSSPLILSDSQIKEVKEFLRNSKILLPLESENYDPISTLSTCIQSKIFIGTNAKLSLWAAIFRQITFGRDSFLPTELLWAKSIGLKAKWY